MRLPRELTREQLVTIVERIRDWLYMDQDELDFIRSTYGARFANKVEKQADNCENISGLYNYINPDKTWDPDTDAGVAEVLHDFDLIPTKPMTIAEAHKPGPNCVS